MMKRRSGSISILALSLATAASAQSGTCTVSSLSAPAGVSQAAADRIPDVPLAKIDISRVTEATSKPRTFKIPNSQLYAHVGIFLNNDMRVNGSLHDSLTVWILITTRRSQADRHVIATTRVQDAFDENFTQQDVTARAKWEGRIVLVNVGCVGKKP